MNVVLLSSDLAVLSRVEGAASRVGQKVRAAANTAQAAESINSEKPTLLIVDLSLTGLDIAVLVDRLRTPDTPAVRVIAFGPHVHEDRLAAAREAGCDEVVSRGQFFSQLDRILTH